MQDPLYILINNETKSMITRYVIFIILFVVLFDQVFSLTRFSYKYDKHYDYGHMMKETCNKSYIEYETERFQLSNNLVHVKIDNDRYNNRFNAIILIMSIIVTLIIAYFFVYIFIMTTFDNAIFMAIKALTASLGTFSIVGNAAIIASFFTTNISDFFYKNTIFVIIWTIVKVLLVIYLAIIIPLYLVVKFNANVDISPFVNDAKNITPHVIIMFIIFLGLLNKQIHISYLSFYLFFSLYIVAFFFIVVISEIYIQENKKFKETNKYNLSENDNLKTLSFTQNYYDETEIDKSIASSYLHEILGFNDININLTNALAPAYDKLPVTANSFKSVIFALGLLILSIFIIWILLYWFKKDGVKLYNIFNELSLDRDVLYSFALMPLVCLYLIIFAITACKEYNTIINKYILYKPISLYKRFISKINAIFNQMLENDKATVTNNSVCKNITNAIHMTIYSNIFRGYKGEQTALFVPELLYVDKCVNDDHISYDVLKEYDIEYYINGSDETDRNIFYNNAKCTSVNNDIIVLIMKNVIPIYDKQIKELDLQELRANFVKQLKFAIVNVMNKKTYAGDKRLELTNDFIANNYFTEVKPSLYIEQHILDSDTVDIIEFIADEYVKFISKMYTYTIQAIQGLCKCNNVEDFTTHGYAKLISKIDNTIKNITNGSYSLSIKKDYINKFTMYSKVFFKTINTRLASKIKVSENNYKLTKYIVKNYNTYNYEPSYKFGNNMLTEMSTKQVDTFLNKEIFKYEDIQEIKQNITDLYANVQTLNALFKNSNSVDLNTSKSLNTLNKNIDLNSISLSDLFKDTTRNNLEKIKTVLVSFDALVSKLEQNKKNYKDLFKAKYYYDSDYKKQLVYDYKMQYINDHINLHKTMYDISLNIQSSEDLFDFDGYKLKYEQINKIYNAQYEALYKLSHDLYKNQKNDEYKDDDIYAKYLKLCASEASTVVYTFCITYIMVIIIANYSI